MNVRLTEVYHLEPKQSTDALIVHHPQAKYFVIERTLEHCSGISSGAARTLAARIE